MILVALLTVASGFLSAQMPTAGGTGWLTNWTTALRASATTGKLVLVDATALDWAPPARRQDLEVFSQPDFFGAASGYVLLRLDYSRAPAQTEAIRAQNEALRGQLQLLNLPTTLLVDKTGFVWGRHEGAVDGGPDGFFAMVDALVKQKSALETLQKSAAAASPAEKAMALHALFDKADKAGLAYEFASLPTQIVSLDKGNKLGLANRYQVYNRYTRLVAIWSTRNDDPAVVAELTSLANQVKDQPDLRQKILFTRGMVQWNALRDPQAAKASFREALPLAPDSATGQRIVILLPELP